jgi:hypothetical protein
MTTCRVGQRRYGLSGNPIIGWRILGVHDKEYGFPLPILPIAAHGKVMTVLPGGRAHLQGETEFDSIESRASTERVGRCAGGVVAEPVSDNSQL